MRPRVEKLLRARSFRWGVNTVASFVVNLGLTVVLHEVFGVRNTIAYAVALTTVFFMNFAFFRYYVFVQDDPRSLGALFATYTASAIGFRLVEYASFVLFHTVAGVQYVVAIVLVQGTSFVAKYFYYGRVFRSRRRV